MREPAEKFVNFSRRSRILKYVWGDVISDAELVGLARAGEADAVGVLLERHRAPLYAAAMAQLRDRDAALDAVQDTLLVALTRLDGIRDPAAVGGWLRAVLRNRGLMQIRRAYREIASDELVGQVTAAGPEQALEEHALRDWI